MLFRPTTAPRSEEGLSVSGQLPGTARPVTRFAVLVGAIAILVSFFRLGDGRTLTSHEAFLAVSTREMLHSGDWIVPRFGGTLRLTKPPLGYWSVAIASLPFGDVSEFTARLPSAIAGLALVALVGGWAAAWYGKTAGCCAALIQATSLYHTLHAREATVDMLQCLLMAAAMFLAFRMLSGASPVRRRIALAFWLLMGLLALAKFHFGPVLVLAPVCVFWLNEWRAHATPARSGLTLVHPVGILLCAVLSVAWPLFIAWQIPDAWQIWRHETIGRVVGEMRPEPAWYFLPLLLYLMLPWTVFYPAGVRASWERSKQPEGSRERFLWVWIVIQVALISVSSNKHKNYIIPALPAVAILLGPALENTLFQLKRIRPGRGGLALAVALTGVAAGTVTALLVAREWPALQPAAIVLGLALGTGGLAAAVLLHRARHAAAGLIAAAVFAAVHMTVVGAIIPGRDYRAPLAELALKIRAEHPGEDICTYLLGQSPTVFYLGPPVHRVEDWDGLKAEILKPGACPLVMAYRHHLGGLEHAMHLEVLSEVRREHPAWSPKTDDFVLIRVRANDDWRAREIRQIADRSLRTGRVARGSGVVNRSPAP